jgi:hypothetical protein
MPISPYVYGNGARTNAYGATRPRPAPAQSGGDMLPRGGSYGVERDFGLRDQFAGQELDYMSNQRNMMNSQLGSMYGNAAGMSTAAQIAAAQGYLQPGMAGMQSQSANGNLSQAEEQQLLQDAYQQVAASTRAMQGNTNSYAASRGLGANPGMIQAMSMAGQFAAAGNRGRANADIVNSEALARERGRQGVGQIGYQQAQVALTPTQENALRMAQELQSMYGSQQSPNFSSAYDRYRNAPIGPGAGLQQQAPPRPNTYPQAYSYGGGNGSGGMAPRPPYIDQATTRRMY